MFNKIAFIALGALAIACGKKSNNSSPNVQPPVTQQPIANEPAPSPVTSGDNSVNLLTQAVGLYQQQDNSNIYLRIDNQMNVETTLQLPIRVQGSDNRLTPTFPQILRAAANNQLETLGYVNRGGNTFDNVTLKVTPIDGGKILDVTMIVKLRQGDTLLSTSSSALNDLSSDESHEAYGRRCGGGNNCNAGCGGGCNSGCGGNMLPLLLPFLVPGYVGGVYPGGPYPGGPLPAGPGDGGTYPTPPPTTDTSTCKDGTCVGQPLEDKEFVYRFIRIG